MPRPLCTRTFGVLYACVREFGPSVYFLPIIWNGISPLLQAEVKNPRGSPMHHEYFLVLMQQEVSSVGGAVDSAD